MATARPTFHGRGSSIGKTGTDTRKRDRVRSHAPASLARHGPPNPSKEQDSCYRSSGKLASSMICILIGACRYRCFLGRWHVIRNFFCYPRVELCPIILGCFTLVDREYRVQINSCLGVRLQITIDYQGILVVAFPWTCCISC